MEEELKLEEGWREEEVLYEGEIHTERRLIKENIFTEGCTWSDIHMEVVTSRGNIYKNKPRTDTVSKDSQKWVNMKIKDY